MHVIAIRRKNIYLRTGRFDLLRTIYLKTITIIKIIISPAMAECNIDIKIATDGTELKQQYKAIDLHLEMHQEKLNKINNDLCHLLGKTTTPLLVIQYPSPHQNFLQLLNLNNFEQGHLVHNDKLYHYANPKSKETIKFVKNIEKEFQKLTRLNNNCALKVQIYQQEEEKRGLAMLNRSKIKGHVQTDQEFVSTFIEVVRRISNQFLNSPPMVLLELLENASFKLELDKVEEFPPELQESLESMLSFKEYLQTQVPLKPLESKGDITIHITLPKLLSLRIKAESSLLTKFLYNFS